MEAPGPDDEEGVLEDIEAPVVMEGRVLGEPDEAPVEEAVAEAPVAAAAPVADNRPAENKPAPAAKKVEPKDNPGNAGAEQNVAKVQTIRGQRRYARASDDDGLRAGAYPQPAARDRQARG